MLTGKSRGILLLFLANGFNLTKEGEPLNKYVIRGGKPLKGQIDISGAKNAAVAMIPAAILVDGVCRIENIPQISDAVIQLSILKSLGADVRAVTEHTMDIDCTGITSAVRPRSYAEAPRIILPHRRPFGQIRRGDGGDAGRLQLWRRPSDRPAYQGLHRHGRRGRG